MVEGNLPMTVGWLRPPLPCLEGRYVDRRPTDRPTDQIDKSCTLTHSHGKDERKRRRITFLLQPTKHAVSEERSLFHSDRERQEGNSVGRFEQRQLSFPRVPFNSLMEYWKRDRWPGRSEKGEKRFSPSLQLRFFFEKGEKLFPSRSQSVLNSKPSCGQLNRNLSL